MSEEQNSAPRLVDFDVRPWAIRETRRRAALERGVIVSLAVRAVCTDRDLYSYDILHILRTGLFVGEVEPQPEGGHSCCLSQRIRGRTAFAKIVIFGVDDLFVTDCNWEGSS